MLAEYATWLAEVRTALNSINMPLDEWQAQWAYDFERDYRAGVAPSKAAEQANRYWWREQNKAIGQDCRRTPDCWLPRGHHEQCRTD